MSTELGAFAVLGSLLLYLTDLISTHPQVQNNKAKWLENIENKVNRRQERQRMNNGIRPTKFQLLQSRFMNNNREPYRKKAREVGKLVMKEKPSANRSGLSSIRSKLEKMSLTEESPPKIPQEKVKWVGSCGKNSVKNILKKFIVAEEKELKEKQQATPQKKALNNNLPKIINKNSVLSKLKEKFEQTSSICSAIEVKALLPCRGEKQSKRVPDKKNNCNAQIRDLRADLRTTTHFNSPQPQSVVFTTVPTPQFCIATEISHPWSRATNVKCTTQTANYTTEAVETNDSQKTQHTGGNRTAEGTAHEGQQKGQLQHKMDEMPTVVIDDKNAIENNVIFGSPGINLGTLPPSCEKQSFEGCIPTLSKDSLDHKWNATPSMDNVFSSSGNKNSPVIIRKEDLSTTCLPHSPTERPTVHSCQEMKRGEIPGIPESMCRPEETEIELAESIRDPPFASQKSFPEQKLVENIPPFCTPIVQAPCNTAPPGNDDLQSSIEPPPVDQMPLLKSNQENAQDSVHIFSNTVQKKERLLQKKEIFSNPTKHDPANTLRQTEPRLVRSQDKPPDDQAESDLLPQKLHIQPCNKDISNPSISKHIMRQVNQSLSSNTSQKEQTDNGEGNKCQDEFQQQLFPVSSNVMISSCTAAVENTDKCNTVSVNEIPDSENENEREMNKLDSFQVLSKEVINHELHNSGENFRPAAEKCQSSSLGCSQNPVNNSAEDNSSWCSAGKSSTAGSIKIESGMKEGKVAIPNLEKFHLFSPNELLNPRGTPGGDNKCMDNLQSSNDVNNSENNAAEDKGVNHKSEEHQKPSVKELWKPEKNMVGEMSPSSSMKKQMLSVSEHGKKISKKALAEEKTQKSNLPSQSEGLLHDYNHAAGKGKAQKVTTQPIILSALKIKEEEEKKTGGKSPTMESKKMILNSKMPQRSLKNNIAKGGDGKTTEISSTQTLQVTPSKQKTNSPGVLDSPDNSKYQIISGDSTKHGVIRTGNKSIKENQLSSFNELVRPENNSEGRNVQDPPKNDEMSSLDDKAKSEKKTEAKQDGGCNSGQNLLPVKNDLPKNTQNSVKEINTLSNLKKDKKPLSVEENTEETNPAVEKSKNICDSGKPVDIPKKEKHAPGNCFLPLRNKKLESLPNTAGQEKKQQKRPQLSIVSVKPKSSVRDEKHTHCHGLLSLDTMEMHEKKAAEDKGSLDKIDKSRDPVLNHDRLLSKKTENKTETQPILCSTNNIHVEEPKNIEHRAASKYQILSSCDTSRPRSEEAKKSGVGGINENQARLVNLEKYIAESYSEEPIVPTSFKPIVIRAIDTIKLNN